MKHGLLKTASLCATFLFCPAALADQISDLQKRVADLEAQMKKGDEKNRQKIESIKSTLSEKEQRLRLSGFATVSMTKADSNFSTPDRTFSEKMTAKSDTKAAVQADFKIDEQWSATLQVMGRAFTEWNAKTEWAFVKYEFDEQLAFRAGRLRFPFYAYSEALDIGFVYPWVRPPMAFYVTSATNYEGVDATYRFATGNFTHEANLFVGGAGSATLPSGLKLNSEDLFGGTYQIDYNALSLRVMAMQLDANASIVEDRIHYYASALTFNDGVWLAMIELSKSDTDWVLARTAYAGQATLGYRIDRWMPYANYTHGYSVDDTAAKLISSTGSPVLPATQSKNTAMGVIFEANPQVNLKFQYDHFYDINGSNANFTGMQEGTDIYSIAINTIF